LAENHRHPIKRGVSDRHNHKKETLPIKKKQKNASVPIIKVVKALP
jgi:hypothetical protein